MHISAPAMNRRSFFLGLAATLGAAPALAGNLSAEEFVQRLGTWVVRLAASERSDAALRQEFARLFSKHVDMDAIVNFALGKYSRRLPQHMRQHYRNQMLQYITTLFVRHRKRLAALEVRVIQLHKRGSHILARSSIVFHNGRTMPVQWRLRRKNGKYMVTDVNLKKIWLSMRLRDNLTSYLDRTNADFAGLLQKMQRETA